MSTYGDNIRKIAKVVPEKDPNTGENTSDKPPIEGSRGIAYKAASGTIVGKSSTPNTTLPSPEDSIQPQASDALTAANEALGKDAKTTADGIMAGNGEEEPVDIADLIDGIAPQSFGPDSELNWLTGFEEIESGQDFDIRMDGGYTPPLASANGPAPTADYPRADTPPDAFDWIQGYYFVGGDTYCSTYSAAVDAAILYDGPGLYVEFVSWLTAAPSIGTLPGTPGSNANTVYQFYVSRNDGNPPSLSQIQGLRCDGTAAPPGSVASCVSVAPKVSKFPSGHKSELALFADGLFKSSEYDFSHVGRAYRGGVSTIVTNFAGGTRRVAIEAGMSNSNMIYEVDSGGHPTGTVRQYSKGRIEIIQGKPYLTSPRRLIALFDASELPKYRMPGNLMSFVRLKGPVIP